MTAPVVPLDWWWAFVRSARGDTAAALAAALADRADWIGRRMADGRALGVPQNEEGLTEAVLLDLRKAMPNLEVRPVGSKKLEAGLGHDWEW